jgi:hypothetical protein
MMVLDTPKAICLSFYNVQVSSINQPNILKFKHIVGNMEVALEILELKLIGWWEDRCYLWLILKTQSRNHGGA